MTAIARFDNVEQAMIAKGMLASYGIEAAVQSDAMSEIFPAPGAGTSAVTLYVSDTQADAAIKLLNSHDDK